MKTFDSTQAFQAAIRTGRLMLTKPYEPDTDNSVIRYMYMWSEDGKDYFKNIVTRKYVSWERREQK